MRIIFTGLLLSALLISGIAAIEPHESALAAETTRLTVVVAQGDKGAAFIRSDSHVERRAC